MSKKAEGSLPYNIVAELIYKQPVDALVRAEIEAMSAGKHQVVEFISDVLKHEASIDGWYQGPVLGLLEQLDAY